MSDDTSLPVDPAAPSVAPEVPVPEWASENVLSSVDHAPVRPYTIISLNGTITEYN